MIPPKLIICYTVIMKALKRFLIFIFILAVLSAVALGLFIRFGADYIQKHHRTAVLTPAEFTENATELDNPMCGWYRIYAYTLSDDTDFDYNDIADTVSEDAAELGIRLALVEFNLKNYAAGAISDIALSQADSILGAVESGGCDVILRFVYDLDGNGTSTEPDNIDIVKEHMEQVCEIINFHKTSIYTLQGVFVGSWGEMHTSKYLSDNNMTDLINTLASLTDSDIFLSVRTPAQYRIITGLSSPFSANEAYSGETFARIGLFNDGMLGSYTDLGTYAEDDDDEDGKLSRTDEIDFQNTLCQYVPNGGEVMNDTEYSDIENAVSDLQAMHVSYLDVDYDESTLNKWKNSAYTDDVFTDTTGYDYIGAHMGYRFLITSLTATEPGFFDSTITLTATVENTGFSACYKKTSLTVMESASSSSSDKNIDIDTDTRYWLPGETSEFSFDIDISQYEPGEEIGLYAVLTFADGTNGIYFANEADNSDPIGKDTGIDFREVMGDNVIYLGKIDIGGGYDSVSELFTPSVFDELISNIF